MKNRNRCEVNGKKRLDVMLTEQNLVSSRERAKTTIMAGLVLVNGQKIDKPGTMVKEDAVIRVLGDSIGYVSRGGLKLAKAIKEFKLDLTDLVVADIGASTGGFTDCSLKNGAKKVFAIDVGYGQLAWSLRTDERVVNMERTNIRYVTPEDIGEPINFASIDVAFISLDKVLPVAKTLLSDDGKIVALIKPQFEAGKDKVGKKGVVREASVHEEVIKKIVDLSTQLEFVPRELTYSPVKGPEGNIEYLILLDLDKQHQSNIDDNLIKDIVQKAHAQLDK